MSPTMRPAKALCLCLFALVVVLAAAAPSAAQQHAGPDGFAICPFIDSGTGSCEPLTDQAEQRFGLSNEQTAIVAQLKIFVAKPDETLLEQIGKSFAPSQRPAAAGDYSDIWLADRPGPDNAPSACFVCGVHLRYLKYDLYQLTYTVESKFTVIWNRAMVARPPQ
jgi:hypothetical protein